MVSTIDHSSPERIAVIQAINLRGEDGLVGNDELEAVEETAAEAVADDRVGITVATEECVVLSVDATPGDAEIEVVGIIEIAVVPASC